MSEISLSAIGADRPGIVSAITGVLADLGCSIEDSAMEVLRSQFAVMLVLRAPGGLTAAGVEGALAGVAERFGLVVVARNVGRGPPRGEPPGGEPPRGEPPGGEPPREEAGRRDDEAAPLMSHWSLTVHGADRPGIVHGVSSVLADHGANIVELRTHVVGDPESPLYAMVIDFLLPATLGRADVVMGRLAEVGTELGVSVTMTPSDDDVL